MNRPPSAPKTGHTEGSRPLDPASQSIIERHASTPGGLLPLLHDLQDHLGYVPDEAVGPMAEALNLSRAEVHGVVTYYHHFRSEKPGRHVLQVCRAESCQACGGDALLRLAERTLGCGVHQTSANAAVSLEPVYCLGMCAVSPAVMLDDRVYARMNEDKLLRLLQTLEDA